MSFRWAVAVVGLFLASFSSTARADADYDRAGPYIGLGAAYAFENFSLDSDKLELTGVLGAGVDPKYDDSAGVDVQIGYRLEPRFAVEFLYGFLEGFDSRVGARGTEIDLHLVTLNAKWFPFSGGIGKRFAPGFSNRLQPYALVGGGVQIVNSEVRDSAFQKPFRTDAGFVGRVGGGLAYYVTESLVVEVEGTYMIPAGGWVKYTDYGSLAFHFIHRF